MVFLFMTTFCKSVKYLDPLMLFTKHKKEYKCFHSQTNSKISTSLVLNTNKSQNHCLKYPHAITVFT